MSNHLGRVQWSKQGVTIYDGQGSFVTRLEDPRDVEFLNRVVLSSLARIREEIQKRRNFKTQEQQSEQEPIFTYKVVNQEDPTEEPREFQLVNIPL